MTRNNSTDLRLGTTYLMFTQNPNRATGLALFDRIDAELDRMQLLFHAHSLEANMLSAQDPVRKALADHCTELTFLPEDNDQVLTQFAKSVDYQVMPALYSYCVDLKVGVQW